MNATERKTNVPAVAWKQAILSHRSRKTGGSRWGQAFDDSAVIWGKTGKREKRPTDSPVEVEKKEGGKREERGESAVNLLECVCFKSIWRIVFLSAGCEIHPLWIFPETKVHCYSQNSAWNRQKKVCHVMLAQTDCNLSASLHSPRSKKLRRSHVLMLMCSTEGCGGKDQTGPQCSQKTCDGGGGARRNWNHSRGVYVCLVECSLLLLPVWAQNGWNRPCAASCDTL